MRGKAYNHFLVALYDIARNCNWSCKPCHDERFMTNIVDGVRNHEFRDKLLECLQELREVIKLC